MFPLGRALHDRSSRARRALVKVNCASVPRELFESEFFGHVKGSFTGALRDRVGRFQLADGGTLFLDEVAEIQLQSDALPFVEKHDGILLGGGADDRKVSVGPYASQPINCSKLLEHLHRRGFARSVR